MNANDFTWKQRGAIDFLLGLGFGESPAPDLFERGQWEEGWTEQAERCAALRVRQPAVSVERRGKALRAGTIPVQEL